VGLRIGVLSLVKVEQSAVSMFYIVGKAEKQAKRWKLKVRQSAVSTFYIVGGLKNRPNYHGLCVHDVVSLYTYILG